MADNINHSHIIWLLMNSNSVSYVNDVTYILILFATFLQPPAPIVILLSLKAISVTSFMCCSCKLFTKQISFFQDYFCFLVFFCFFNYRIEKLIYNYLKKKFFLSSNRKRRCSEFVKDDLKKVSRYFNKTFSNL